LASSDRRKGWLAHPTANSCLLPAPRACERVIQAGCSDLHIPCIPSRLAILTQPLHGRAACHYCGQCNRGCSANANFNSPGVHIFPALKTGNLEVRTGAMAREVVIGRNGLASGVSYVEKKTHSEVTVYGKVVVLAASACETARILLNSKSTLFPQGLANASGEVGRNLMDSVSVYVSGYLPVLQDLPPFNEDGTGGAHLYIPSWLYPEQ
jgi:choline dehydrogenase-like flavoprotein